MRPILVLTLLLASLPATAQTLRMAAIAPDGSAWAREMKGLAHELEAETEGALKMKWYLGGIAGTEREALDRVARGQLDGLAGTGFCEVLAPSWRALSAVGLFRSRAEAELAVRQLHLTDRFAKEFDRSGFELLGVGGFGHDIVFSRLPFHSMDQLRKIRLWAWNDSVMAHAQYPALGLNVLLADYQAAEHLYDQHQVDGFIAMPTAALVFQWSSRAHYFANLPLDQVEGCLVVSKQAFQRLSFDEQKVLRSAAAKFAARFDLMNGEQEQLMLTGLLQHQGLIEIKPGSTFRTDFYSEAAQARRTLDPRIVDTALVREIDALLEQYRRGAHVR